jgi:hypothetical protein
VDLGKRKYLGKRKLNATGTLLRLLLNIIVILYVVRTTL